VETEGCDGAESGAGRQLEREIRRMVSACWCGLRSLLAPWLSTPPEAFPSLRQLASAVHLALLFFLPAVTHSPGLTVWIPPKIRLPLTITMISKQSHRMSRISSVDMPPLPQFPPSLAERHLLSEVPGLAQYAVLLKFAPPPIRYRNSFLIIQLYR
jgi:hypothetical protein